MTTYQWAEGVTWVPGRSGGEQGVEQGARRGDDTQAVDTHVVDVTRPRQLVSNLIWI